MALLSTDMIREIQNIADVYVERERARIARANAEDQRRAAGNDRDAAAGRRDEVGA